MKPEWMDYLAVKPGWTELEHEQTPIALFTNLIENYWSQPVSITLAPGPVLKIDIQST